MSNAYKPALKKRNLSDDGSSFMAVKSTHRCTRTVGPEFIAHCVRDWITAAGVGSACTEPGSPWENGYCESFNARFRDELLDGEIFHGLREAQILIEHWRQHYNTGRPHNALRYRPPAPDPET